MANAQGSAKSVMPLFKLSSVDTQVLAGCGTGLYSIDDELMLIPLWTKDKVLMIKKTSLGYYFLTGRGILYSSNLKAFEERNSGLPFLTVKHVVAAGTEGDTESHDTLEKQVAMLKDLAIDPLNESTMVTASKDSVYITWDGAKSWQKLGSMSRDTAGMKAVAVATIDNKTVVFMSHPIFGLSYCIPTKGGELPTWHDCTGGFDVMPTQTYPDEIADILPVVVTKEDGTKGIELYMSQSYIPRVYRFDWARKRGVCIYRGSEPQDTIDALSISADGKRLIFTALGRVSSIDIASGKEVPLSDKETIWTKALSHVPSPIYSAFVPKGLSDMGQAMSYSELWLLHSANVVGTWTKQARDRKAIYIPAHQVFTPKGVERYRGLIRKNKLNALVIDMKDDYGLIHYHSDDPLILAKGKESRWALDLDDFVGKFKKEDGVYMVARIVTFKDPHLAEYDGGKLAVWNRRTNAPWQGTRRITNTVTDEEGNTTTSSYIGVYDEQWIDPYSSEVWEYDVAIAQELVRKGFDEVQFDYIRFPTDGLNLGDAVFRHKSPGMDKESALISFLSYARENISAPIGIDIYGANGWYRSGTRTGQDVELLAEYVDVICPMFYPSHFENSFLNCEPWSERPYRIYYYGTYRNTVMGRGSIVVRPWVQAFKMNVSYDRQYFGRDYVRRQVFGVRDSCDTGYMYWNNAGNYEENLSPDPGVAKYPFSAPEASLAYRKPALGTRESDSAISDIPTPSTVEQDKLHILNTVRQQEAGEGDLSINDLIEKEDGEGEEYKIYKEANLGGNIIEAIRGIFTRGSP